MCACGFLLKQDAIGSEQPEALQQKEELPDPASQMRAFRDPLQDDTGLYVTEEVPSQPEGKIGLPRANPRGRLRSPS